MANYDEGEHVKEVFAYFGRAHYEAGVLETGLAMALLHIVFLSSVKERYLAEQERSFDRVRYEAEFDKFMADQHAQSLGNLVKRVAPLADLSDDLKDRLKEAKRRRDFLSHHYFRERAIDFGTRAGRDRMIAELRSDGDMFEQVDKEMNVELAPVRERLGLSGKRFQEALAKIRAEIGLELE